MPEDPAHTAPLNDPDENSMPVEPGEGPTTEEPVDNPDASEYEGVPSETSPESPETADGEEPPADAAVDTGDEGPKRPWVWWVVAGVAVVALLGIFFATRASSVTTPNTVGMAQADAQKALAAAGLKTGSVQQVESIEAAPGVVTAQNPPAGTEAKKGDAVDLAVAALPMVDVPDVLGKPASEASQILAEKGLRVGNVTYDTNDTVDPGLVISQSPPSGTSVAFGSLVDGVVSKGKQQGQVPNVVGLPETDAKDTLQAAGFEVQSTKAESTDVPAGDVIKQSPAAGVVTAAGSVVTITVSKGAPVAPPASVKVPNVVGMTQAEATDALNKADLEVDSQDAASETVAKGDVISQSPGAGKEVDPGSTVIITVSSGAPAPTVKTVPVPDVVGQSESQATGALESAGFKVTTAEAQSTTVAKGDVIEQSPKAGADAESGSTVAITVSTGAPEPPVQTPPSTTVKVPNVIGQRVIEAFRTIRRAQLKVAVEWGPSTENIFKIEAQTPKPDTSVDKGSVVTLEIGLPEFFFGDVSVQPLPSPAPEATTLPAPAPAPTPVPAPAAPGGTSSGGTNVPSTNTTQP